MFHLALLAIALPDALLNRPYVPEARWERVSTRCAMPIPTTRVVGGALPPGLQMTGRGDVEGLPTEPGLFAFTVEISDGCSKRLEQRQIRVMPAPILVAEAETYEYQCLQGTPAFSGGLVRISGSAPGRAYTVDLLDAPWLKAAMRDGVIPAEGLALEADTLRLTVDPGMLRPGLYTARLRVSTWQGANTPELLFKLRIDSPATVLTPLTVLPTPVNFQPRVQIVEAPSPRSIEPPTVAHVAPPKFPKYIPKPKPKPLPAASHHHGFGRSRVLPFPKVTIPKSAPNPEEKPKPEAKTEQKKEESKKAEPKKEEAKKQQPKPEAKPPAKPEAKQAKAPEPKQAPKKEAPPERTKPSAMPPPAPAAKH